MSVTSEQLESMMAKFTEAIDDVKRVPPYRKNF
jgi:hypothetical protein